MKPKHRYSDCQLRGHPSGFKVATSAFTKICNNFRYCIHVHVPAIIYFTANVDSRYMYYILTRLGNATKFHVIIPSTTYQNGQFESLIYGNTLNLTCTFQYLQRIWVYSIPSLIRSPYLLRNCGHNIREVAFGDREK